MAITRPGRLLFVSLLVTVLLGACKAKPVERAQASELNASDAIPAVRIASLMCLQAAQDRDLDRLTGCFTDDAATLAPKEPAARGKDEARRFWSLRLANPGYHFRWQSGRIEAGNAGEMAYETGTYEMDLADQVGRPATTQGKFLIVWKRMRAGQWKIAACTLSAD